MLTFLYYFYPHLNVNS